MTLSDGLVVGALLMSTTNLLAMWSACRLVRRRLAAMRVIEKEVRGAEWDRYEDESDRLTALEKRMDLAFPQPPPSGPFRASNGPHTCPGPACRLHGPMHQHTEASTTATPGDFPEGGD